MVPAEIAMKAALDVPGRVALLCDFDGVIAPIVDDPAGAEPLDGMVAALTGLLGERRQVGLVSGRPAAFLENFFDERFVKIGLYGLEVVERGVHRSIVDVEKWRPVIDESRRSAASLPALTATRVESKGLSLTVHYRGCPDREPAVAAWVLDTAARTGLRARRAKMAWELHPPVNIDKGTAIESLFGDVDSVVYLGDDVGDLAALDGLDRLSARGARTLAVAVDGPGTPSDLLARADHAVAGPVGVLELFDSLGARGRRTAR